MTKTLKVYLTYDIYERLKILSTSKKESMSSIVNQVLALHLPTKEDDGTPEENVKSSEISHVLLKGNPAVVLKERAYKAGVSPTAFIRDVVLNQNMKHIVIEPSLGRQIIEAFRDYDMDLQYLIHLYKSDASVNDKKEIIESVINGIADLTKLIIKYHKKLTRSHLALRDDILAKIKEDKSGN